MGLAPGTRVGPYEIAGVIGAGGMGEVYRAHDTRLNRDVAVKFLPPQFAVDPDRIRRFEQEARTAGSLNHPNVLTLFDLGMQDGSTYIVSELLEGQTLRQRLSDSSIPPRKALDFAIQIANGLAAAHDKGIVHRDLKPDNLFVTKDGRVKILDFGLAKLLPGSDGGSAVDATGMATMADSATEPGMVMGTVGYMSPEQVQGRPADHRSDVFSLGAVLYEMVSGRRAFRRDTPVETMNAILKEDPPAISDSLHIPAALERLIRRALEKSPEERFHSARDFAFALEALSAVSGPAESVPLQAPRKSRWLIAASVAVLVAAVGAASFVVGRRMTIESKTAELTFTPVTSRPQSIFNARFAPDGQTIVYSAALEGSDPEVFTIGRDYPEPRSLGLRSTHLLSVSSKGELALLINARFFFGNQFIGTLARMPLGGDAPRELLENVKDADWMPNGESLVIVREVAGKHRLEFPVGVVLYETTGHLTDLRLSPKGDLIAFIDHPSRDLSGSVTVVNRTGGRRAQTGTYGGVLGLAWSPGGDEILFGEAGDMDIRALTLSGATTVKLRVAGTPCLHDVSQVGRLLMTVVSSDQRILAGRTAAATERNLGWLGGSILPFISRDRQMILFSEEGLGGGPEGSVVCLRKMDGSPVVRLGPGYGYGLSPDGKWALATTPESRLALYPTGVGETRTLASGPIRTYYSADWFPDGRRVLACSIEPGHTLRCYVQDIAGGAPRAVTDEIGTLSTFFGGLVSPNGTGILARSVDGRVMQYPVEGGPPQGVAGLTSEDVVFGWASDGRSIFVGRGTSVPVRVERFDLATARRTPFADLAPQDRAGVRAVGRVNVASDGESYAYAYSRWLSSLYLVDGVK